MTTRMDTPTPAQSQAALERHVSRLSILNSLGLALTETLELQRVYRTAYEHIAQLVDCATFSISRYDPAARTLRTEFMFRDGELLDPDQMPALYIDQRPAHVRTRAIATGQAQNVADLRQTEMPSPSDLVGSALHLPMVVRGQVIGLLEMASHQPGAYGAEEVTLLGPVANQIGLALENARLFEETRARAEQLALLNDAGLAINRAHDPHTQLRLLFEAARQALHADRVEFFSYDPASNQVRFKQGTGYDVETSSGLENLNFHLGEARGFVAQVGQNRVPLYLPDVLSEPNWIAVDPGLRSGLWAPVEHEGQLRGVLAALSTRVNAFTPQDQQMLALFANQAATAMENSRLLEA